MKIKASELTWMIREAIASRVREIMEAGADPDAVEKGEPEDDDGLGDKPRVAKPGEPPEPQPDEADPSEPNPADDAAELDKQDALDMDGDAAAPSGKVNREVDGKTIQSISVEEDSKLVPGAHEVVVTLDDVADPLRIIVAPKSGRMSFFWRGQMHDLP